MTTQEIRSRAKRAFSHSGMTQRELARRTDTHQPCISRWLRGESAVLSALDMRIFAVFNIRLDVCKKKAKGG